MLRKVSRYDRRVDALVRENFGPEEGLWDPLVVDHILARREWEARGRLHAPKAFKVLAARGPLCGRKEKGSRNTNYSRGDEFGLVDQTYPRPCQLHVRGPHPENRTVSKDCRGEIHVYMNLASNLFAIVLLCMG